MTTGPLPGSDFCGYDDDCPVCRASRAYGREIHSEDGLVMHELDEDGMVAVLAAMEEAAACFGATVLLPEDLERIARESDKDLPN